MLNHLHLLIEADAAQKGRETLRILRASQARNKIFWALFTGSALLAFVVVLLSVVQGERPGHDVTWIWGGIAAALIIIAVSEHFRNDLAFLDRQTYRALAFTRNLRFRRQRDFLCLQTWFAYGLVLVPVLISVLLLGIYSTGIAKPGTESYAAAAEVVKQLITLAAALLAAQIGLFNFLFGQLLGKYSSRIAVAVSQHPVVRLLRNYSILLLAALSGFYLLGFPNALPKVAFLLVLSWVASVFITIWVSNTGIRTDLAIVYSGHQGAKRVARSIKAPILSRSGFWNAMAALALDWRRPERMVATVPPEEPASTAMALSSAIFNAAHKSIQENQHETLLSSLQALSFIVDAYVSRRRQYFGSTDQFLGYLNDQLAAVVKAAAKSPNEYMVTNAVTFIGIIGSRVLEVGRGPSTPKAEYPESHAYFSHWQGLLAECFELTHRLRRSTAASEALIQMSKLTKKVVDLGYGENASMDFPSELTRIYMTCLATRDPYHLSLAGQCMRAIMDVWRHCSSQREAVIASATGALCDAVKKMALAFQSVEKLPSFDLGDPVTTVTSKVAEDRVTLQDIALSILTRPVTERWQRASAVSDFHHILDAVGELWKDAAAKDLPFAKQYADVFYELALLTLIGLPSEWNESDYPVGGPYEHANLEKASVQELFERKLTAIMKDLIPLYHRTRIGYDWEQELFSIIGMAAAVYSETKRESARLLAVETIACYRDLLADKVGESKRVRDNAWDFLQLLSVWARHLLQDTALADGLIEAVAHGRPFRFSTFGIEEGGKHGWGIYGYPNVFLGSDFFLANPRNIARRLSETVLQMLKGWQDRLMSPDELRDTYGKIETIREPIRERIVEQRRKREEMEHQTQEADAKNKAPSS